jgi:hypothetical protein
MAAEGSQSEPRDVDNQPARLWAPLVRNGVMAGAVLNAPLARVPEWLDFVRDIAVMRDIPAETFQ